MKRYRLVLIIAVLTLFVSTLFLRLSEAQKGDQSAQSKRSERLANNTRAAQLFGVPPAFKLVGMKVSVLPLIDQSGLSGLSVKVRPEGRVSVKLTP